MKGLIILDLSTDNNYNFDYYGNHNKQLIKHCDKNNICSVIGTYNKYSTNFNQRYGGTLSEVDGIKNLNSVGTKNFNNKKCLYTYDMITNILIKGQKLKNQYPNFDIG